MVSNNGNNIFCLVYSQARIQDVGAGAGAHSWDKVTRAEAAGGMRGKDTIQHHSTKHCNNILKCYKSVTANVRNHPSPSHISIPGRPPLAEILHSLLIVHYRVGQINWDKTYVCF